MTRLIAATLLLFVIVADLAADTRCHPRPRGGMVRAGLSAVPAAATDQDPCGAECVPDCFCCSTLSVTAAGVPVVSVALAGRVAPAPGRDCPPGVHPRLYRPPIARS